MSVIESRDQLALAACQLLYDVRVVEIPPVGV